MYMYMYAMGQWIFLLVTDFVTIEPMGFLLVMKFGHIPVINYLKKDQVGFRAIGRLQKL